MEDRLGIIGFVHGAFALFTDDNEDSLKLCLVKAFPDREFEYGPATMRSSDFVEYTVIEFPFGAWALYPVGSKPKGWTWQQLVEIGTETRMLVAGGEMPKIVYANQ